MKEAADIKSNNIVLSGIIPLPDGRKGAAAEEVETCNFREKL